MKSFGLVFIVTICLARAELPEEKIELLKVGDRTFTNCTLRILNVTNGVVTMGSVGARINLAELPEPYRAKYYDEKLVAQLRANAQAQAAQDAAFRLAQEKARKEQAEAEAKQANEPWVSNEHIEVSNPNGVRDRLDNLTITGTLKNKSKRERRRLAITFSVYDARKNKIGEARDYLSTLGPGETWKFEAFSFGKSGSYSLESVTCSDGRLD